MNQAKAFDRAPSDKIEKARKETVYALLSRETRAFLDGLFEDYRLTFQEFRFLCEAARDLDMWEEASLEQIWADSVVPESGDDARGLLQKKKAILKTVRTAYLQLRDSAKKYSAPGEGKLGAGRREFKAVRKSSDKKIFGECPVASEETVCCNLKTIDVVENCAFGCSYCTIQTFYGDKAVFDPDLGRKLDAMELDADRSYHFGTGQSSDSLIWGNRDGILDRLCAFAAKHPNVLLEFKTKSERVEYFLDHEIPANVVCSWSLNADAVIRNEEHFTASLEKRLRAARKAADRGIPVAFHFHPMVFYENWEEDYRELARRVQILFRPGEVLFLSFGSVTFIKPVMKEIRKRGGKTKILQMELVAAPKGKFSYPDELKIRQFRLMHQAFESWQDQVFMYLCMEPASIWDAVFGSHYPTNDAFEMTFSKRTLGRIFPDLFGR